MTDWINIEDRLPSDGKYVLVCNKDRIEFGIFMDGELFLSGCDGLKMKVTHWNIPTPPKWKEENNKEF